MKRSFGCLVCFMVLLTSSITMAQTRQNGPIISEFGPVFVVDSIDFKTDTTTTFKVVFDIMNSPDDPSKRNKSIETAARFLNMHAQNGIPKAQMQVALVVHDLASKDILTDAAYSDRYQQNNPNSKLIKSLLEANVEVILCGQSAVSRKLPKPEHISGVQLALSAMTALIQLQNQGYTLIKF